MTKWRTNGEGCLYWFYGIHLFSDVTILTRKITSRFLILNSELYFNCFVKNCIALTIIQNNHPCIQLVFEYIAMLAQVCQILNFFMCLLFFWKLVSIIFVIKSPFFIDHKKTKFKQILLIISQNKYLFNEWCILILKPSRIQ